MILSPTSRGSADGAIPSLPPTFVVEAADLADHPLLDHIPVWPKDSEEFKSLRESLHSDGQLYEVLIDSHRRVIDGRNRRNALAALGQMVVCRAVADEDVSTIIFRTLMQRRHLGKGARAFLAVPLVEPLIEAARARKINSLRQNATAVVGSSDYGAPTMERIALDVGVARDTFFTAKRLHELLAKAPEAVRIDVTARVLSGELELGYACTAVANYREAGAKAEKLGKRQNHDELFVKWCRKLPIQWEAATPAQRARIGEEVRSEVCAWPVELVVELSGALKAAAKRAQS